MEINLRKQTWLIIGIYNLPKMKNTYFYDHLIRVADLYSTIYERFIIMEDFNMEPSEELIEDFCDSFSLYNFVKENTCFKDPPKCFDLILTNCKYNFQNIKAITTGYSEFHKMTVLKTEFVNANPLQINYRDFTQYNSVNFEQNLGIKFARDQSSYRAFYTFQHILCEVLEKHAPLKTE